MNVLFVANDLHDHPALSVTSEFTEERNHTNVMFVARHLFVVEV